jgi:hypothetical protein
MADEADAPLLARRGGGESERRPRPCGWRRFGRVPQRDKLRCKVAFLVVGALGCLAYGGGAPVARASYKSLRSWARGDVDAPTFAERRRLDVEKSAICRSVYYKVQPNANKIRGKDRSDGKKEKIREGQACTETMNTSIVQFFLSIIYVRNLSVSSFRERPRRALLLRWSTSSWASPSSATSSSSRPSRSSPRSGT